nr:sigma factor-like helix-turn-helix DNA-binding protein [Ruminococcus flavefaciens]
MKELGDPDSTIIIQQYYYNRTAKEIAKSISMSAAAVQKRSSRAKQKLRILLTEAGINKEGLI